MTSPAVGCIILGTPAELKCGLVEMLNSAPLSGGQKIRTGSWLLPTPSSGSWSNGSVKVCKDRYGASPGTMTVWDTIRDRTV